MIRKLGSLLGRLTDLQKTAVAALFFASLGATAMAFLGTLPAIPARVQALEHAAEELRERHDSAAAVVDAHDRELELRLLEHIQLDGHPGVARRSAEIHSELVDMSRDLDEIRCLVRAHMTDRRPEECLLRGP